MSTPNWRTVNPLFYGNHGRPAGLPFFYLRPLLSVISRNRGGSVRKVLSLVNSGKNARFSLVFTR